MIPEREREALMRLTMCARIECDICKYKESSIDECDERITENMNILADALRKTEPTISKMEQVDKDINVRSKTEPQTNADQHAQRIESVETMSCQECKRWIYDDRWGWFCPLKSQDECKYEPKDEPQTDCLTCRYNFDEWDSPKCDGCSKAYSNYEPQTERSK